MPLTIADNGTQSQEIESVYLQDEWKILAPLTLNYGLRFDHYSAYSSGSQLSPRVNFVWQLPSGTTVHGGYSRYFTPPPFELIGAETFTKFAGTSAELPGAFTPLDSPPIAARANYYDFGIQQKLLDNALTLGVDSFYEQAAAPDRRGTVRRADHPHAVQLPLRPDRRCGIHRQLLGEGFLRLRQCLVPGRTRQGRRIRAVQLHSGRLRLHSRTTIFTSITRGAWPPPAACRICGSARASAVTSSLAPGCAMTSSFRTAPIIPNGDHTPSYTQVNLGVSHDFLLTGSGPLTARVDVINLFDKVYQIRSGTGIGVFAPQYGPRRGLYAGLAWKF